MSAILLAVDRVFLNERTGAAALNSLAAAGGRVVDPARAVVAMDHIVDTVPGSTVTTTMPGGIALITLALAGPASALPKQASEPH